MNLFRRLAAALILGASAWLAACSEHAVAGDPAATVVRGKVSDVATFADFIATRPTPAQFRGRYPDVRLVLPGEIASKEFRLDRSRYFAELDDSGRIVGGTFK